MLVYPQKTHQVFWGTYPGVWALDLDLLIE